MYKVITSGVRLADNGYEFDTTINFDSDLIELSDPQLYYSHIGNRIYRFGYQFNPDSSSSDRSKFIRYIKGLEEIQPSEKEINAFIEKPLAQLDFVANISSFDGLAYPLSGRSRLVTQIVKVVNTFMQRDINKFSFEFIKSAPIDIEFDWESFEADYGDDLVRFNSMKLHVINNILPAIKNLDYFSLAQNVKTKYRPYIKNFLSLSQKDIEKYSKLYNDKILVVDDINTSGSTLKEILRILQRINNTCEIYVFTLIEPS